MAGTLHSSMLLGCDPAFTSGISMRVCHEGHANALALNREASQIAVAGRSLLKVFSVENDGFTEVCNMRGSKNQNLSYSSNDVAWSNIDNNILATAATNGLVSIWDLSRFGRHKQMKVYSEHKRTATTVTFHSRENYLISGSQDGTIKAFDLRNDKAINTFFSNAESVRDAKFCPFNLNIFAAVSENGTVQIWDMRKADKVYLQYTAHSGPIYACDWHPTEPWLATGSRDKQIKIWDMEIPSVSLKHTIHTIAVVGRVKWRPNTDKKYKFHLASCAMVVDYSIYIWDIRRPYIPYAAFDEHSNVTTGICWMSTDANILLSTSKDSTIYKHTFKHATFPANTSNPHSANLNISGDMMYSYKIKVSNPPVPPVSLKSGILGTMTKVQPNQQNYVYDDTFHLARSVMHETKLKEPKNIMKQDHDFFLGCAKEYLLHGKSITELCDHNASIAVKYGNREIGFLWSMIKTIYAPNMVHNQLSEQRSLIVGSQNILTTKTFLTQSSIPITVDDEILLKTREDNGVTTVKDETVSQSLSIPDVPAAVNSRDILQDFVFGHNDRGVDNIMRIKSLRNGFLYIGPHDTTKDWLSSNSEMLTNTELDSSKEINTANPLPQNNSAVSLLRVNSVPGTTNWEHQKVITEILHTLVDFGDVQTAISILIVLEDKRNDLHLDDLTMEHWMQGYIELLHRNRLWIQATEIMNRSNLKRIIMMNQQSTAVHTNCGNCNRPTLNGAGYYCPKCKSVESSKCCVCKQVVRGLYAWCQGCSHGGHLVHLREWFSKNETCPKCGHACSYEQVLPY